MSTRRIAIFTLTKDRLDYTRRTFEDLRETTHVPYDHFVIDNGSTDGTVEYLEGAPQVFRIVANGENRGIGLSWNQAIDEIGAGYDYIVKLDNDCEILTNGWLEQIIEVCEALGRQAVLSPYVEGLREHEGGAMRSSQREVAGHEVGETRNLGGIALIAPTHAYEGFRFSPSLPYRGNQDSAFSAHLRERGYFLGYVEDVRVRHMDTTQGQHERYPDYFAVAERERWTVPGRSTLFMRTRLRLIRKLRALGVIRNQS